VGRRERVVRRAREGLLPEHAAPRNVLLYRPLTAESDLYSAQAGAAGRLLRDEPAALHNAYMSLEDVQAAMLDESPRPQVGAASAAATATTGGGAAPEGSSAATTLDSSCSSTAVVPADATVTAASIPPVCRVPNLLHVVYSDKPTARFAVQTAGGGMANPHVGTLVDGTSPVEPIDGGRIHLDAGSVVPQPVGADGRHVFHSFFLTSNVTNLNTARPVQYVVSVPPGNPLDAAPKAALVRAVAEATNTSAWGEYNLVVCRMGERLTSQCGWAALCFGGDRQ
jgi:hypothetical protein